MAFIYSSANYVRMFLMVDSSDHISPKTGLTPTVLISKNGSGLTASVGAVAEVGSGFYKVSLNSSDTTTFGDLGFHCIAAGADNTDFVDQVIYADLTNGASLGMSFLNTSITSRLAAASTSTNFSIFSIDANGRVLIGGSTSVLKNAALGNFPFMMINSGDHVSGMTGLTVVAQRSIDGGAFSNAANSVAEVGSGWYKINLANTDLNGNTIALKFTSPGADATNVGIATNI